MQSEFQVLKVAKAGNEQSQELSPFSVQLIYSKMMEQLERLWDPL